MEKMSGVLNRVCAFALSSGCSTITAKRVEARVRVFNSPTRRGSSGSKATAPAVSELLVTR